METIWSYNRDIMGFTLCILFYLDETLHYY